MFEVAGQAPSRSEDQGAWLALRKECDLETVIILVEHEKLCRNY
jgi:hypothetical protein